MKILKVEASARTEGSASRRLADRITAHLVAANPGAEVTDRDVGATPPPILTAENVVAFNTPADERDAAQLEAVAVSESLMNELRDADAIVIGVPVYNFGIPAAMKAWIDQVCRARETFRYTPDGPKGLLEGKKAYVALASGGTAMDSDIDFATPYLRHVLGFIGITDVEYFAADGLVRGGEEKILATERTIDDAFGGTAP